MQLGLSQAKLGELVGRSPSTVRAWERDKSTPSDAGVLHALSAILGLDEHLLFEKVGQVPPPDVETSPTVEEALASLRPPVAREHPDAGRGEIGMRDDSDEQDQQRVEMDNDAGALGAETEPDLQGDQPLPFPRTEPVAVPSQARPPQPGYVAPPEPFVITSPTPPLVEPSYVEDQNQRQLYRARNLATLVVGVALVIALIWALGESLSALGSWWDDFFGSLRL